MSKYEKHPVIRKIGNGAAGSRGGISLVSNESKKMLKSELAEVFRKYGYLDEHNDHEINIKITSGSITLININSIEIIK
ncbi:MAG: hypothetical protein AB1499_03490 [Nitrospirota bacterium]